METSVMLFGFLGVKVALAVLFWVAISRGLALGERIEARQRAERAAAEPEPAASLPRPAEDTPAAA